jgi:hypothetical protein
VWFFLKDNYFLLKNERAKENLALFYKEMESLKRIDDTTSRTSNNSLVVEIIALAGHLS